MTIKVVCTNGHSLKAKDSLAGKKVACPKCGCSIQIPSQQLPSQQIPSQAIDIFGAVEGVDKPPDIFGNLFDLEELAPASSNVQSASDAFPSSFYSLGGQNPTQAKPAVAASDRNSGKTVQRVLIAVIGVAVLLCSGVMVTAVVFVSRLGRQVQKAELAKGVAVEGKANRPSVTATTPTESDQARLRRGRGAYTSIPQTWTMLNQADFIPVAPSVVGNGIEKLMTQTSLPATESVSQGRFQYRGVRRDLSKLPEGSNKPGLTQVKKQGNLIEVAIPSIPWRTAYDTSSGNLLVSNDRFGFIVYSVNSLATKNVAPLRRYAVQGAPSAACIKPTNNNNLFVFTGSNDDVLYVVDAATGEPKSRIRLELESSITQVACGTNPEDPFVYVLSGIQGAGENSHAGILGRINIDTGQQDYVVSTTFTHVAVSHSGELIYATSDTGPKAGSWGAYKNLSLPAVEQRKDLALTQIRTLDRSGLPVSLTNQVALGGNTFDLTGNIQLDPTPFMTLGSFSELPGVVGWSFNNSLCFASAFDRYIVEEIELPDLPTCELHSFGEDFRSAGPRRLMPGKDVNHTFCDDKRGLALVIADQTLVVARLNKKMWEADTRVVSKPVELPTRVMPGELLQVPLASADRAVEVVRLFNSSEDAAAPRSLGWVDATKLARQPLRLAKSMTAEDSSLVLEGDLGSISNAQTLRIDNELMTVAKLQLPTIQVERKRPVEHLEGAWVAPLDKQGRSQLDLEVAPQQVGAVGTLVLSASVNSSQEIIFVNDCSPMNGMALPQTIRIEDELMEVVSVDDLKEALIVTRTSPVAHSVSSSIVIVAAENVANSPDDSTVANLPTIENGNLQWKPTPAQTGRQFLRLRFREKGICREEVFPIDVITQRLSIDEFQIAGIEVDASNPNMAVIWGADRVPRIMMNVESSKDAIPEQTSFVGIYDLAAGRLVRYRTIPRHILSASLRGPEIYVCASPYSLEKFEPVGSAKMSQAKIYALSAESLEITKFACVDAPCIRLQVIGEKFLGAHAIDNRSYGFHLPELRPVFQPLPQEANRTFGRVGDGWVWDGVLWDESFSQPQLLISAHQFRAGTSAANAQCAFLTNADLPVRSMVKPVCDGFSSGEYLPDVTTQREVPPFTLHHLPVEVMLAGGVAYANPTNSVAEVVRTDHHQLARFYRPILSSNPLLDSYGVPRGGDQWVTENRNQLLVALEGDIFGLPVEDFRSVALNSADFRIEHHQDHFTLNLDQEYTLKYSAPGASKYTLVLHRNSDPFSQVISIEQTGTKEMLGFTIAESENGEFKVQVPRTAFVRLALAALGPNHDRLPFDKQVQQYLNEIAVPYQQLTGRRPTHIPVPYYAVVFAERNDLPNLRALMVHAYLVDVPVEEVAKSLAASN